jgi:hypothetical protein
VERSPNGPLWEGRMHKKWCTCTLFCAFHAPVSSPSH